MKSYALRRRLVLVMLFSFFLGLGGASLFYWAELQELREQLLANALRRQAAVTGAALAGDHVALDALPIEWATAYVRPDSMVYYALYGEDGAVLQQSPNLSIPLPPPFDLPLRSVEHDTVNGDDIGRLTIDAGQGRLLQVARADLAAPGLLEALSEEAIEFIFYTVLPFAMISIVAIWLVVWRSLRPVLRASEAAFAIGGNMPGAHIPVDGLPDEVRPLVDAANGALARLGTAYRSVQRLTADAAHELRTPLAALTLRLQRSRIDGQIDWPAVDRELGHLRRLVQQMLTLARREGPDARPPSTGSDTVNLARLAREVAGLMLPLAEGNGRTVEVEAPMPVLVTGHKDELHDMLRNLVENALDHGKGLVTVTAGTTQDGHPVLSVHDEGAGIPPELGEDAFDRFRKGNAASAGAGLGLAIVRRVVERHQARINTRSGQGWAIEVTFDPVAS